MEILVCAQYAPVYVATRDTVKLVSIVACCFVLASLESINSFAVKNFAGKMIFFAVESSLLLALCILTGNSYLSTMYCVVLTQYYLSVDDAKSNTILFIVSCGLYIVSYVVGWVAVNKGASLMQSIVQILGDCILGVFILGVHFAVINFLLAFYSNNKQLRNALKEADESKAQLK